MEALKTRQHLLEGLARRAGLQTVDILGRGDAAILARETAREIAMDEDHHVILGHLLLDRLHEGAFVETRGMVVVLHEARHQREVVGGLLAARIGQGQNRHVELTARQGRILLARLEQRLRGENADLEVDIGGGDFVGHDLGDLVAHIRFGPLMRQAQIGCVGRQRTRHQRDQCGCDGCFHKSLPWNALLTLGHHVSRLHGLSTFLYARTSVLRTQLPRARLR